MTRVITYSSPTGATIRLTETQIAMLRKAGTWPRDWRGQEYCTVSHGLHNGIPDYTDSELRGFIIRARTVADPTEERP